MPNKSYVKGRKKEYAICKRLREEGYDIVQRTAGSHSPVDVIAINKEERYILLIQSKPKGYKSRKYDKFKWLSGKFFVRFKIE